MYYSSIFFHKKLFGGNAKTSVVASCSLPIRHSTHFTSARREVNRFPLHSNAIRRLLLKGRSLSSPSPPDSFQLLYFSAMSPRAHAAAVLLATAGVCAQYAPSWSSRLQPGNSALGLVMGPDPHLAIPPLTVHLGGASEIVTSTSGLAYCLNATGSTMSLLAFTASTLQLAWAVPLSSEYRIASLALAAWNGGDVELVVETTYTDQATFFVYSALNGTLLYTHALPAAEQGVRGMGSYGGNAAVLSVGNTTGSLYILKEPGGVTTSVADGEHALRVWVDMQVRPPPLGVAARRWSARWE